MWRHYGTAFKHAIAEKIALAKGIRFDGVELRETSGVTVTDQEKAAVRAAFDEVK